MLEDCFGASLSTRSETAVQSFNRAQDILLRHCPDFARQLGTAFEADPNFCAAHALAGFGEILLARTETLARAQQFAESARTALPLAASQFERTLVDALELVSAGAWRAGADVLASGIDLDRPHPVLVKIAHMLRFMSGDVAGMVGLTAGIAAREETALPGYGFILGCHAFALEEAGQLDAAEVMAQRALNLEPGDIWGMHALAHVYDIAHRTGEGLLWVESGRQQWSKCNNFARHMAWHLGLFHIDRGNYDRALELYDADIACQGSEDFRDVANAVSLLARLRQMGVSVGSRFEELHAIARRRRHDVSYVFASLHHLVALVESRDLESAEELVGMLAASQHGDQSRVAQQIGAPLARVLIEAARKKEKRSGLTALAELLPSIGGSIVQRDVFLRSLIIVADDVCDHVATGQLVKLRSGLHREDAFAQMMEERRCFGGSSETAKPFVQKVA